MRTWMLLITVSLAITGCEDTGSHNAAAQSPTNSEIDEFVRSQLGNQLFISMMRLRGQDGDLKSMLKQTPPGISPGGINDPRRGPFGPFGAGTQSDPAERYVDSLASNQPFARVDAKPALNANLYDCDLPANITALEVTGTKSVSESTRLYFIKVTQELAIDLVRLRNAADLKKAIHWNDEDLRPARSAAAALSSEAMSRLQAQWSVAETSRRYVLERVHRKGSEWTSTGEVRATFNGDRWTLDLRQLKAADKPSVSSVTPDHAPAGLMIVDPSDYASSAAEWRRPYQEFMAAAMEAQTAEAASVERRSERLIQIVTAGKSWRTVIEGSSLAAEFTVKIEHINDNGMIYGEFVASRDGKETVVPVFGALSQLTDADVKSMRLALPDQLLGAVVKMQVDEPAKWPQPWSELEFYLGLAADDEQPTLIWLNNVKKLQPVQ